MTQSSAASNKEVDPKSQGILYMNNNQSNSKNVLNSDVELKGTLKFSGELTFDGKLEGDINSDGALQLGDNAVVKGNINTGSVVIRGKITGNVVAKEKIEIKSKTELFGDIRAPRLAIEEGVTFVGRSDINPNKVAPTPAATPAAASADGARNAEPAKAGRF
ncbi:MAG TPA: polymer-forming cytoskeletal protein [Verrucomicrobiae bacterium]|nr:polymer-forming cytoskeletal protein [Verrucomicrobiae bacterium]